MYVFSECSVPSVSDPTSLWGRIGEIIINIDHDFASRFFPRNWPLLQSVGPHLKTDSSMKSEVFYWGDYLQPLDYTVLFRWCMQINIVGFPYIGDIRCHYSSLCSSSIPSDLALPRETTWLLVSVASGSCHPHCVALYQTFACKRKSWNCMSGICELCLLCVFVENLKLLEIKSIKSHNECFPQILSLVVPLRICQTIWVSW